MRILTNVNVDWLRWRWHSLALSWLVILAGIALMTTRGLPLGIDFSGGTLVVVRFEQAVGEEAIRNAIPGNNETVQRYGDAANEFMIRLPLPEDGTVQESTLEQTAAQLVKELQGANLGTFEVLSTEFVGPVIGRDLQLRGLFATAASLLGIAAYIWLRFEFSFAVGALVASVHDVLITLSILTLSGYELSLNTIAAILTLVGYGVNDQIVVFDRVRENRRTSKKQSMETVINTAVNQTLPRTVVTAGTTFLAVLSLYLFGGEVLEGFAFAMLVGIITSTYSTVFIASAIAVVLSPKTPAQRLAKKAGSKAS
ncbi:MAG TPA: protein translocase subunit SecF [Steroidobacteraceae bacterium]|nr:protein translocase subunit SecF [Steroidobacteraceae bacterium]